MHRPAAFAALLGRACRWAADAALYDGKHSGKAMLAPAAHAPTLTVNGRRAGRPGTAVWGRAA
ncbi:hypothetical protein STENM223S_00217 [Streptomyces tendae]